jgi:hypothetical protein
VAERRNALLISTNTRLQSFVTLQLHQQYLARNINGYRCHSTTGVPYPYLLTGQRLAR